MPPRLDLFTHFRTLSIHSPSLSSSVHSTIRAASTAAQKNAKRQRRHQDPYAAAQARARRAANLSRQATLRTEREKALGDPVRGVPTSFVESFDTGVASSDETRQTRDATGESPVQPSSTDDANGTAPLAAPTPAHLNNFVSSAALRASLAHSQQLSRPPPNTPINTDPRLLRHTAESHARQHENASQALSRIVSIENSSAKDRMRINVQRCIEHFGRHNTDNFLRPRPRANNEEARIALDLDTAGDKSTPASAMAEVMTFAKPSSAPLDGVKLPAFSPQKARAGPDTGSSEVQIAILTAKIRQLAGQLEARGHKDKVNKRNLRLLVHRRQKLLRYLRQSEKGGERWRHCVETLGLTEGTFVGEISL